jgi:hypothetical protein
MRKAAPFFARALVAGPPDAMTLAGLGPLRIGTSAADLRARDGSRMRVEPHPYMGPEGKYLTWGGGARSVRVGCWRSVQLIKGCS